MMFTDGDALRPARWNYTSHMDIAVSIIERRLRLGRYGKGEAYGDGSQIWL